MGSAGRRMSGQWQRGRIRPARAHAAATEGRSPPCAPETARGKERREPKGRAPETQSRHAQRSQRRLPLLLSLCLSLPVIPLFPVMTTGQRSRRSSQQQQLRCRAAPEARSTVEPTYSGRATAVHCRMTRPGASPVLVEPWPGHQRAAGGGSAAAAGRQTRGERRRRWRRSAMRARVGRAERWRAQRTGPGRPGAACCLDGREALRWYGVIVMDGSRGTVPVLRHLRGGLC